MATEPVESKRSALFDVQVGLSAVFTTWNGYYVADHFGRPTEEYWAVRLRAGIIDMSALQKFDVVGPDAVSFLNRVLTRDVAQAVDGQALYSPMCNADGGFLDDGILYRTSSSQFMLVTGGGERDHERLRQASSGLNVALDDITDLRVNISVQGPGSRALLQGLTTMDLTSLAYYHFTWATLAGCTIMLARTGYSGELGYELFAPREKGPAIWKALAQSGEPEQLVPYGFKALDVLRIEAGLPFCGYDMDATTTPYDVGLGWAVDLEKEHFIGRDVLARALREGPRQQLVGFEMEDMYFPEIGARVFCDGRKVGVVTSAAHSLLMEKSIGLARLSPEQSILGTELQVEVSGRTRRASVVRIPFYDPQRRRRRA